KAKETGAKTAAEDEDEEMAAEEEDAEEDAEANGGDESAAAAARVRRAEAALPKTARKAARTYADACVKAAHVRAAGILSSKAAQGREAMALTLVCDTSLTVGQAVKRLEAMPKAGGGLAERMEAHGAAPLAP